MMNFRTAKLCFALALASGVTVASALAQISPQGGGYLLRLKFAPNDKANYVMKMTGPMAITMPMSQVVKSVKNGIATVEYTVGPMAGGPTGAGNKPQKITAQLNNRGKIVSSGASSQIGQQTSIELPAGPIKVGGTWSATLGGANMGGMTMKASYKLLSVSGPYAKIGVTMSGGSAQMKMSGTGTTTLRIADGSMQSMQMKTAMSMQSPGGQAGSKPMNVNSEVSITRK